jgi:hypothetical protein
MVIPTRSRVQLTYPREAPAPMRGRRPRCRGLLIHGPDFVMSASVIHGMAASLDFMTGGLQSSEGRILRVVISR